MPPMMLLIWPSETPMLTSLWDLWVRRWLTALPDTHSHRHLKHGAKTGRQSTPATGAQSGTCVSTSACVWPITRRSVVAPLAPKQGMWLHWHRRTVSGNFSLENTTDSFSPSDDFSQSVSRLNRLENTCIASLNTIRSNEAHNFLLHWKPATETPPSKGSRVPSTVVVSTAPGAIPLEVAGNRSRRTDWGRGSTHGARVAVRLYSRPARAPAAAGGGTGRLFWTPPAPARSSRHPCVTSREADRGPTAPPPARSAGPALSDPVQRLVLLTAVSSPR